MQIIFITLTAVLALVTEVEHSEGAIVGQVADSRKTSVVLKVGAFNIQTFGKTKMSKAHVAEKIRAIVEMYDILLIQEIRDTSVDSVRQLLSMLTLPFDFIISEPLGRTTYKEQYAFFYRTDKLLLLNSYQYEDHGDVFEREPFVVRVAPRTHPNEAVSLIALHAKPEDATAEIGQLKQVVARVQDELDLSGTTEPVVLGDLNADCSYATLDKRLAANDYLTVNSQLYKWLVGEDADTTTRASTDCAYDRIIVRSSLTTRLVPGSVRVFDFGRHYGMTEAEALEVSDHYPVEMQLAFS